MQNLPINLLSLKNLNIKTEPAENGKTHEENALIKAKFYYDLSKIPILAEDSGIEVEALKGEMGINTRRWGAGEKATDEEWLNFFMDKMKNFPNNREAKFICVACYFDGKSEKTFNGQCQGIITEKIETRIKAGIPLSSCFKPENSDKVYSALTETEKAKISHRGEAIMKFKKWIIRNNWFLYRRGNASSLQKPRRTTTKTRQQFKTSTFIL